MFLKRVEMHGFKSFADKTVISFEHAVTGIVGPNGCGKSNISDAVRWVLGEQSAKSLRGEKMNDVIFAGSADRRKLNMAEVTLVFDNSNHILNTDNEEVEVTRRLYRDSGDAEYQVNRKSVRLKDIVDLFLDTGLGRDSLSIISQGNVISFAEAKPVERRGIFEEAAGVAKFKKRKIESLSKLERTKENLERSHDILAELEKQVVPLKRQARKAEIYREKKKRLEEIEITVLVQDIEGIQADIESAAKSLFDIETNAQMYRTEIQIAENVVQESRREIQRLDNEVNALQDELMRNYNETQALENRKTELDEKRKYIVETGNKEQKAKELKEMLDNAFVEYEDRSQRLASLRAEMNFYGEKLNQASMAIAEKQMAFEQASVKVRSLETRKGTLEQLARNPFNNQAGVRSIMQNKDTLHGILGVIGQVLNVKKGYEEAVSTALGGAVNYIITADEQASRDAIRFLNRNMSGRATFYALTLCRERYVNRETLVICENAKGYLGIASDFVTCEPTFLPIVKEFLQNVLVVDEMEAGNELSALTGRRLKIVTLNGEVIHAGGSMTGGKTKHDSNVVTLRRELEEVAQQLDGQKARLELASRDLKKVTDEKNDAASKRQEKMYAAAALEPVVEVKKAKYEKLKNEYSLLNPNVEQEDVAAVDVHVDELIVQLNAAYGRRDEITNDIKGKREQRMSLSQDSDRKEAQLRQIRKELSTAEASINAIRIDQGKLETRLEASLARLSSEYQLTYEFARTKMTDDPLENAREEVAKLRADIERLGNVNMEAPEQYAETNERYEKLKSQIEELTASRDKILAAINEMDDVMTKQFKEMFDAINREFDAIFKSLYGGGSATLFLQDPSDILNTGIDINAQPPGKAVQNNRLFSGGEKSLIALCVLFAILKVKPVPLVILDEVEAALDPGNVERFAQYLHNYTHQTQFIVVTHRAGTMENADVLYGVTMQHQGVSQMLKVELREALDMAETTSQEDVA